MLYRPRHCDVAVWLLLALFSVAALQAQSSYVTPYTFTTFAGTAGSAVTINGVGNAARFDGPFGVAVEGAGNVHVAESVDNTIRWGASAPPVLFSATTATEIIGQSFSYTTVFSGTLTGYSASGLPAGLAIDSAAGVISGIPTVAGAFPVTRGAINGAGLGAGMFTLTVSAIAPVMTLQPVSHFVTVGANVTLSVTVSGAPASTYQWHMAGIGIPGATSATCAINKAQLGNTGNYSVVVTNSASSATSSAVTLSVVTAPVGPGSLDLNNDGHPDILWRNTVTGDVALWFMNGTAMQARFVFNSIPLVWQIGN